MAVQAAHGTLLARGDDGAPEGFTNTVPNLTSITPFAGSVDVLDASNHDSASHTREKLPGYVDPGGVSFSGQYDPSDSKHDDTAKALYNDFRTRTRANWRITFLDGDTLTADAFLSEFSIEATDGDLLQMSGSLTWTTIPTWA